MATKLGRILMLPKGAYSPIASYSFLDVVEKDGSSYVCKKDATGIDVTNTEYWMLIASRGNAFTYDDLTDEQKAEIAHDATLAAERAAQSVETVGQMLESAIQTTETTIVCLEEEELEAMSPSLFVQGVYYFGLEELPNTGSAELEGDTLTISGAELGSDGVLELSGLIEGSTLTL